MFDIGGTKKAQKASEALDALVNTARDEYSAYGHPRPTESAKRYARPDRRASSSSSRKGIRRCR